MVVGTVAAAGDNLSVDCRGVVSEVLRPASEVGAEAPSLKEAGSEIHREERGVSESRDTRDPALMDLIRSGRMGFIEPA